MEPLTKPKVYNIEDSNVALLGSGLERSVREEAGSSESAWKGAGLEPGLKVWRIEKFNVVEWPKERTGVFYDGDSYIILHTFKKTPDSDLLSYDLHFWLGENTTQDEAGTAAYKTVELDDHLHGKPVQYREVQGYESTRFLSYFPKFVCLKGGVSTGFHHVTEPPPLDLHKLYRVTLSRVYGIINLVVREVMPKASSLIKGDVYVLDMGVKIWQFNTKASLGKEKFKAAEFTQSLANERQGSCEVTVFDEGGSGAGVFLSEFGEGTVLHDSRALQSVPGVKPILLRISDATGQLKFQVVEPPSKSSLHSSDAFLLDNSSDIVCPAVYVWIGEEASLNERRLTVQYAQRYLYDKRGGSQGSASQVTIPLVRVNEGRESEDFLQALVSE